MARRESPAASRCRSWPGEFLEFLELNRNVSPHTLRAYDTDLSSGWRSWPRGPDCRPSQVPLDGASTPTAFAAFSASLHDRGNSRASTARRLAAVRTFARYLVREEHLAEDPTALVGSPRKEQTLPAHLTAPRHRPAARRAGPSTRGRPSRSRPFSSCSTRPGLRLSELVALDLEDVNLGGRVVRVRGKGGKERLVPFNQAAAEAIRAMTGGPRRPADGRLRRDASRAPSSPVSGTRCS